MKSRVYIILGPTASGKTAVAIELAKLVNGEIISADSMQIYRGMDIGTAKPAMEERQGIPHHMFDVASPDEAYSVAMFQLAAKRCIEDILGRGRVPIVAGGTGLYLNALTYQLDFTQTPHDAKLRAELEILDTATLHRMLEEQDKQAAQRIHPNDKKRMIRRLEILRNGGGGDGYEFSIPNDDYHYVMAGLTTDRAVLYQRINARVDAMIAHGLVEEVKGLAAKYQEAPTAMQAIGYKEIAAYLNGETTMEEAVSQIKRNSRRYAKRQLTWFKRDARVRWYDTAAYPDIKKLAEEIYHQDGNEEA